MKLLILIFALLVSVSEISFAQCGKKLILTASKTLHLDENGNITRTTEEKSVVQITDSLITVTINDDQKPVFHIKSLSCSWKVPFKEGRTFIAATMLNDQDEVKNINLTIEGSEGKLFLLFNMEDNPDSTVKVLIDRFEEVVASLRSK